MLLTPHTLVGVVIGATVQNPVVAIPLSFAMHFAGDLVPHWDFFTNTTKEQRLNGWRPIAIMLDLILGVAFGLFFTLYALWVLKSPLMAFNIFGCGIAAVLPDALVAPSLYMNHSSVWTKGIYEIQRRLQFPADLPWGMISQIIVVAFCLLILAGSLLQ